MTQGMNRNPTGSRATTQSTSRKPPPRALLAVGGLLLALVAVLVRGSGSGELPAELHGHWTTAHPRYEGRGFTLSEATLELYSGPSQSRVHPVRGIEKNDGGGRLAYTIRYEDGGAIVPFTIAYGARAPSGAPEWVHFPNQPEIEWRKTFAR
jgi:hypothetical protein